MGLSNSKIVKQPIQENVEKTSVASTPISTPQSPRKNEIDPRSPSTNISRTPLEIDSFIIEENEIESGEVFYSPMKGELVKCGIDPRSPTTDFFRTPILLNTSKNNLLLNSSDDNIDVFSSPVVTKTKVLGIDPRSPTNEFMRTPIMVTEVSNDKLIKVLHNKNLEKVIQSEICTTPTYRKDITIPKLLESSPIRKKSDAYKRKSFVGLLETNIDFTETDIDAVLKQKCRIRDNDNYDIVFENNAQENCEVMLKNNEDQKTKDGANKVILEIGTEETQVKILPNDENLKDKFEKAMEKQDEFDLNEVVDMIVNENKEVIDKNVEKTKEVLSENVTENNIEENDKSMTEVPQEIKSAPLTPRKEIVQPKSVTESKSAPVTPPLVNITADVKELDKKLSNLIYEDQDIVVCPRIVQLKDLLERSPLKSRNRTESETKKSAQKLKVSDKPRKSDFAVSKIPVFKITKNKVQCENTPPRNMERKSRNGKKTQWDNSDVTLYL